MVYHGAREAIPACKQLFALRRHDDAPAQFRMCLADDAVADAVAHDCLVRYESIQLLPATGWTAIQIVFDGTVLGEWYEDALDEPGKIVLGITCFSRSVVAVKTLDGAFEADASVWASVIIEDRNATDIAGTNVSSSYVAHERGVLTSDMLAIGVRVPNFGATCSPVTVPSVLRVGSPNWRGTPDVPLSLLDKQRTLWFGADGDDVRMFGLRGPATAAVSMCKTLAAVFLVSRRFQYAAVRRARD
jgi:hypothetical protein